jgi:hypothetical protein
VRARPEPSGHSALAAVRHDVRVDITAAAGTGERLTAAATVILPASLAAGSTPCGGRTVVFAYPGGGYNCRYYDLQVPGPFRTARSRRVLGPDHAKEGQTRS